MRRGDIWLVEFDPVRGSEANNRRPAVVVSNDRANPQLPDSAGVLSRWSR